MFFSEVEGRINNFSPITHLVTFRLLGSLHEGLYMEDFRWRTLDGEPRFPKLFRLMAGLLCIPSANTVGREASPYFRRSILMKEPA